MTFSFNQLLYDICSAEFLLKRRVWLCSREGDCVGDGNVYIKHLNFLLCDCNQLDRRFKRFFKSGLCHDCQVWNHERKSDHQPGPSPGDSEMMARKQFGVIHYFLQSYILGQNFEVRYIKTQPALNGQKVRVVDVSKRESWTNMRAVCVVLSSDKTVALRLTNLVTIGAAVEDINSCELGHRFRGSQPDSDRLVRENIRQSLSWAADWEDQRPDQKFRVECLQKYLTGELTEIPCKLHPDYPPLAECDHATRFSALVAAVRPGCVGDNLVHLASLRTVRCECHTSHGGDLARWKEFIVSGQCLACQLWYIERADYTPTPHLVVSRFKSWNSALEKLTI